MTDQKYVPQAGDRVRFTAEGVVMTAGNDATYVRFTGSTFGSNAIATPGVGTWERLPDTLPTTPGSVVRATSTGYLRFLTLTGWMSTHGEPVPTSWMDNPARFTVLFDAGKGTV